MIPSPWPEGEIAHFLEHYFYSREAFLLDEVLSANLEEGVIRARTSGGRSYLVASHQRGNPKLHPRHVSGSDLIMITANLGSLHAYFFHDCKWQEGWVGFGNRIRNAVFKNLADPAKDLELESREVKVRKGDRRVLIEYAFEFTQDGNPVYQSEQTAMFVRPEVK